MGTYQTDNEDEQRPLIPQDDQPSDPDHYGSVAKDPDALHFNLHIDLKSLSSNGEAKFMDLQRGYTCHNHESLLSQDGHTICPYTCPMSRRKAVLKNVKVAILMVLTIGCSLLFVSSPERDIYQHQVSVSAFQSQEINVTDVSADTPVVRMLTTGSFLSRSPAGHQTHNINFRMVNPVTRTAQTMQVVVVRKDLLRSFPESTREFIFDFSNESLNGHLVLEVSSNTLYSAPLEVAFLRQTSFIYYEVPLAAVILFCVYILIVTEVIHRCLAAMLGALAAIGLMSLMNNRPSLDLILTWLDYNTLTLLFGMMILVTVFCESGFFDWAALKMYMMVHGKTWPLITILCGFAAVVSAFMDNVTTILLLSPVTIRLCEVLELDAKHILIAIVIFSNLGGTMTAIGDPPNVLLTSNEDIQQASDGSINFATFTLHMTLGSILVLVASYFLLRLLYRRKELLKSTDPPNVAALKSEIDMWRRTYNRLYVASREEDVVRRLLQYKILALEETLQHEILQNRATAPGRDYNTKLEDLSEKYVIRDKPLLIKSGIVIILVIVLFFVSSFVSDLTVGWIAIIGAMWLLVLVDYSDMESVLNRIEWATLLFFAALFILMGALESLGLMKWMADVTTDLISNVHESARLAVAIIAIQWISALASCLIDNIPFTTAMIPVVVRLAQDSEVNLPLAPLVYALAFGTCLGGNGTLIGASANVVCAGIAENHGHGFTFWQFFKVGFPVMLVSSVIATAYLLVCHVLIGWNG